MPTINYASKEIQFKIVYYGPALSGKTTNLVYIHSRIAPAHRGDLPPQISFIGLLPVQRSPHHGWSAAFGQEAPGLVAELFDVV